MIRLKSPAELELMREAGRILARTMRLTQALIEPGKTTVLALNDFAEKHIRESGGVPSFKGYKGFPAAICAGLNEVVVHGIPDETVVQEGDIIKLDFGVIYKGWHADSAWTFGVGEVSDKAKRLMKVTLESLNQGIAKAKRGNRVGDISATVQRYVESNGYSVVRDLVGHGIGQSLHEEPSIPNFGKPKDGPKLVEGMTFCIEPMVNEGTWKVRTLPDDWTIVTQDGKLSAHFEHTVAVTKDGPIILTQED